MQELLQFHIDHNYYINIQAVPNTIGCIVNFPPNLFLHKPEIKRLYLINEDLAYIDIYHTEHNKTISKNIKIEKFGIRLLILEDVSLITVKMGMSTKLILGNLFTILKINMTKEELELEKNLCIKFRELLIGKENVCVIEELNNCYRKVLECFENGGL